MAAGGGRAVKRQNKQKEKLRSSALNLATATATSTTLRQRRPGCSVLRRWRVRGIQSARGCGCELTGTDEVPVISDGAELARDTSLDVLGPLGDLELATLLQVFGVSLDEGVPTDIADGKTGHLEFPQTHTQTARMTVSGRHTNTTQSNTRAQSRYSAVQCVCKTHLGRI